MRLCKILQIGIVSAALIFSLAGTPVYGQYVYQNRPALKVVEDLQQKTDYRFLYREAMLAGIRITVEAKSDSVLESLASNLEFYNIRLKVDPARKQVLLFQSDKETTGKNIRVSGQVIDAATGERLPLATLTWQDGNRLRGVTSNAAGVFNFTNSFQQPSVIIRTSYVGYAPEKVELNLLQKEHISDLTIRLRPETVGGNEIIITGTNYYASIDTSLQQSVDIGTFSPLGETNTIRALQQLPAININTALQDGINVRGSASDGFHVLLDNITIYNQSHLFGLVDSFNADALQTGGLFYDITPAQYQAPPGGTLALYTKTGSLQEIRGSGGISNSSYRLTLGGPIRRGSSSWLISGRNSYMNTVNWLNNSKLIEWGLNVNRPREILTDNMTDIQSRLTRTGETDATFFDLHGKLYLEGKSGSRLIFSGYYGQDNTSIDAERLFRTFDPGSGDRVEYRPVETDNDWSNLAGSVQYQLPLASGSYSYSSVGVSIYETDFFKEDFSYIRLPQPNGPFQLFDYPFQNKSIISEVKAEQKIDFLLMDLPWTLGSTYHYYYGEYYEDSFDRSGFLTEIESHLVDGYAQVDINNIRHIDFFAGLRVHWYSNGHYLKWSPRIKAKLFPNQLISASLGYSKNYQFLNEISLSNVISSDIWVLANRDQPPSSVDYYSAGLYFKPFDHSHFQVEAYLKDHKNVRLHEINTFSISNTFAQSPWFYDNSGKGRGLEFFLRNQFQGIALSQSFTILEMKLENPVLNDGEPFYVDWDRRYRYSATLEVNPIDPISAFVSLIYATGNPNKLAIFGPDDEQRLGNYMRTDIGIDYERKLSFGDFKTSISLYNVFDRNNTWYRDLTFVLDQSGAQNRFQRVPVNVYDLGIQPAFNISVSF